MGNKMDLNKLYGIYASEADAAQALEEVRNNAFQVALVEGAQEVRNDVSILTSGAETVAWARAAAELGPDVKKAKTRLRNARLQRIIAEHQLAGRVE